MIRLLICRFVPLLFADAQADLGLCCWRKQVSQDNAYLFYINVVYILYNHFTYLCSDLFLLNSLTFLFKAHLCTDLFFARYTSKILKPCLETTLLEILDIGTSSILLSKEQTILVVIRLPDCIDCSAPL